MSQENFVVYGGEPNSKIPQETMGNFILDNLKLRNSEDIAMVDLLTETKITFGDILKNCIQLADVLRKMGIKKGDAILIISENNLQYYAPVIAGLLIGAVVNPINPAYKLREISHAINISKPKIAFASENVLQNLVLANKNGDIEQIVVFEKSESNGVISLEKLISQGNLDIENFEVEMAEDAVILLSSGTTGHPKGVLITHENMKFSTLCFNNPDLVEMNDKTVTIAYLPFFHIFGMFLLIYGVAFGTKMILLNKFKPDAFLQAIEKNRVNLLLAVPSIVSFLAKTPLLDEYDVSSLKTIICGSAPICEEVARAMEIRIQCEVRDAYGMTELSGPVIMTPKGRGRPRSTGLVMPAVYAKVWDWENNKIVGPNEPGELCFKCNGIMKRYVDNEEETKQIIDSDGFLHSGDVGYYDEDGYFYIIDRIKELIKYKGFQVSPAELESVLLSHGAVKDVGVVGIPDPKAGEVPVAFVVKQPGRDVTEQELVDFVTENVSVQKRLYGGVRFVEELPKNATGKTVRKALKQLAYDSLKEHASV